MTKLTVNTNEVYGCRKCKADTTVYRHHKGNDSLLGRFNKRIRRQYYEYRDCVRLCLDCHCEIHYLYQIMELEYWIDFTPRGANTIRKRCIKLCDKWLAGDIPSPEVPVGFKQQFKESLIRWRKEKQATG